MPEQLLSEALPLILGCLEALRNEFYTSQQYQDFQTDRTYTEWLEARVKVHDALRQLKELI